MPRAAGLARPADRRRDHPPAGARHPSGDPPDRPRRAGPASPAPTRSSRSAPPTSTLGAPRSPSPTPTREDNAPREATAAAPGDRLHRHACRRAPRTSTPSSPATALTVAADVDGLPAAPKPGDGFTLTLTDDGLRPAGDAAAAAGRPDRHPRRTARLPAPAGARRTPGDPQPRREATTYVIEEPGAYASPPSPSTGGTRRPARSRPPPPTPSPSTSPLPPAGTMPRPAKRPRPPRRRPRPGRSPRAAAALFLWRRRHPKARSAAPTERSLYHDLRRAVRRDPPANLRPRLARWLGLLTPG